MANPVIQVHVVPHAEQRYETVGDWQTVGATWVITVSNLGDWRMNLLVAVHELVEQALCTSRGIPEAAVTAFDLAFEAARADGNTDEPGDDRRAPYRREHRFAENIERQLAHELGVDWHDYEERITAL